MGKFKRRDGLKSNVSHMPLPSTQAQLRVLASTLLGRAEVAARMGKTYGTDRDIYTALGYTKNPIFDDYWARYERQDVAKRIIDAPVSATWRDKPEVTENKDTETQFEKEWKAMVQRINVFHYLSRADKISGIGEYGVLVLGFDDGGELHEPVERARELLYMRPYSQNNASIDSWVKDTQDPRFGMPETYKIDFSTADKTGLQSLPVHYTRVIHIAEGLLENEVYGTPRLRPVLNRLQDLDLVSGGSAEMFWRGAFPGFGFKNDPDAMIGSQSLDDLETEIEEYMHGLKRYMRLQNITVESLSQQVANPKNHVDVLISLISAATGIPKRILSGSEMGELASSQDKENWADRIDERRRDHAEPMILRAFVDRNIEVGVLPQVSEDGYEVTWPEIYNPSDEEQATVAKTRTDALVAYANSPGADLVLPPEMFLKKFLGLSEEEVEQAQTITATMAEEEAAEIEEQRRLEEEAARLEREGEE